MYDIEMHQMSPEFRACWHAAGRHLQHQADGRLFWLRAHPHPPVLEHLSFRLGNQLFFVRVEDESGEICGPGSLHGLFSVALEAKGCPCLLPMRRVRGGKWVADLPGWGLVLAGIGKAVDPVALITDKQIEMTVKNYQEIPSSAIDSVEKKVEDATKGKQRLVAYWNLKKAEAESDVAEKLYKMAKNLTDASIADELYDKYKDAALMAKKKELKLTP